MVNPPRNLIRFRASFKLKPRALDVVHDRTLAFLTAVTTFTSWQELTLRVRPPARSKAQRALYESVRSVPGAGPRFDRDALVARGVELDELCVDALTRFGPAHVTSQESSSSGPWCALTWSVTHAAPPPGWLDFCGAHAALTTDEFPRVPLLAAATGLTLIDPTTRQPLPFQAATDYPPTRAGDTYRQGCFANAWLFLPRRELTLDLRLPFERADADFEAFVGAIDRALGQPLSRKHWYSVLASKAGTSQYERKLVW